MNFYFGLVFVAVILTGVSQILLKIGSRQKNTSGDHISPYLNAYTISAYVIFLLITMVSVVALKEIPLKLFYAISSLTFVVVALLSWSLLKEEVNKGMCVGILFIVLGIVVFNL
jgi:multidrug transporter EmrE-like cation transporter